ncbi:hypothetical protein [Vibrio sp. ArtGut-C1]|uniref:hypothetical protein n=1 Tax=Vibrio sp. ArtGut-C1 TaxID=2259137 RepID=UPI000A196C2D|nr:hypothetical protein [Vibrio sp. ArtGut-C1]
MEYIPAIFVAVFILVIFLAIWLKINSSELHKLKGSSVLLATGAGLFCIILIVHLFKEQAWTADILKLLIGVLTGAAASSVANKYHEDNSQRSMQTAIGNEINQAGRDIIGEVKGDIQDLKDSVVNQYQSIKSSIETSDNPIVTKSFDFRFTANPILLKELELLALDRDSYSSNWIEACLNDDEISSSIRKEAREVRASGWSIKRLVLDNLREGLYVRFECERIYELDA